MSALVRRFLVRIDATSAVEFALILPLLLMLLLGSAEFNRYYRYARHLEYAADTAANMTAQRQAPLTLRDLNFDLNTASWVFRELITEAPASTIWWQKMGHQFTMVVFTPTVANCKTNCSYVANVAWVWPEYKIKLDGLIRSCGALQPAADDAAPSGSAIPARLFGPGSLLVVDMTFDYKPQFGAGFIKPIRLTRQAFYAPRFATPYLVATPDVDRVTLCPGY